MKISYVLPVYNVEHIVAVTLNMLIKQTHTDKEIIVVNDCSTDHTREVLEYFKDDITIINNSSRSGAAYSRNIGNSLATGDIIAVCDADSYTKQRGDAIEAFFEQNPGKGVYYSAVKCVDAKNPAQEWGYEAIEWDFKSKCPISHPTVAYKRELAEKYPYHEISIETDLFEFMLLDMHAGGVEFGGGQQITCIKIEGDTERDREAAADLKREWYKKYGIELPEGAL